MFQTVDWVYVRGAETLVARGMVTTGLALGLVGRPSHVLKRYGMCVVWVVW
jgi:hypothetical protein